MAANSKMDLMRQINELSFVLDEMRLFLDTHTECEEALEYYNKYAIKRKDAVRDYTRLYGPLRFYDINEGNCWQWANEPWPWEGVM